MKSSKVFSWPLVVTVICWAYNFVALKLLYRDLSPPATALIRFCIMTAGLVLVSLLTKQSLKYPKGRAVPLLLLGASSMGIYMILFLSGMQQAGAAEGAIILATAPIFTMFIAAAKGMEQLRPVALVGAVLALGGVALIVLTGSELNGTATGRILLVCSAAVWAFAAVQMKPLLSEMSPLQVLTLSMPGGLVVLLPWAIGPTLSTDFSKIHGEAWLNMGHVALLSGVAAFLGFYRGVQQIGSAGAMLYQYCVPPLAALFAWWTLGQSLVAAQWWGFIVVIFGVATAQYGRSQHPVNGIILGSGDT